MGGPFRRVFRHPAPDLPVRRRNHHALYVLSTTGRSTLDQPVAHPLTDHFRGQGQSPNRGLFLPSIQRLPETTVSEPSRLQIQERRLPIVITWQQ